jgi:hypothetical protein
VPDVGAVPLPFATTRVQSGEPFSQSEGCLTRRAWLAFTSAVLSSRLTKAVQESTPDLYNRCIVIDGLANAGTCNVMWPPAGPLNPKQLASIASSGITAINHTVTQGAAAADFEPVVAGLAFWNEQVEQHANNFVLSGDSLISPRLNVRANSA